MKNKYPSVLKGEKERRGRMRERGNSSNKLSNSDIFEHLLTGKEYAICLKY
jgi:hypothetical protein